MKKLILLLILLILFAGCNEEKHITIMTAASLTEVVEVITDKYSEEETTTVSLNFAGSQALTHQILNGAEADIMISANKKYILDLEKNGFIDVYEKIAGNKLIVAVNTGVTSVNNLNDIIAEGLKIAIADESVPVGSYTKNMLEKIDVDFPGFSVGVYNNVVSKSLSVKEVIAKVELGEVDCGIVYMTDCNYQNKDTVKSVEIAEKYNIKSEYYAGVINKTKNKEEAENYMKFLKGKGGREFFKKYNFELK